MDEELKKELQGDIKDIIRRLNKVSRRVRYCEKRKLFPVVGHLSVAKHKMDRLQDKIVSWKYGSDDNAIEDDDVVRRIRLDNGNVVEID